MEQGWLAAMLELYKKKDPKETSNSKPKAESDGDKDGNITNSNKRDQVQNKTKARTKLTRNHHRGRTGEIGFRSNNHQTNKDVVLSAFDQDTNNQQPHCSRKHPTNFKRSSKSHLHSKVGPAENARKCSIFYIENRQNHTTGTSKKRNHDPMQLPNQPDYA